MPNSTRIWCHYCCRDAHSLIPLIWYLFIIRLHILVTILAFSYQCCWGNSPASCHAINSCLISASFMPLPLSVCSSHFPASSMMPQCPAEAPLCFALWPPPRFSSVSKQTRASIIWLVPRDPPLEEHCLLFALGFILKQCLFPFLQLLKRRNGFLLL